MLAMESRGKRLVNKVLNQENSPVPSSTCGLREIFFSPYHADASDGQKSMKNQEQEKTEWDKTENDVITKEDDTENNTTRRDNTMNTTAE
ncbi:hypothetical protein J6590_050699 [Homalodisca vitripennis]|nr:hypothetical protein J6590_050699 [Homalodisca vitripennis]